MSSASDSSPRGDFGFVYLVRIDRFHKIGSSSDPSKRVRQFDNGPYEPHLVHVIESRQNLFAERLLQRRFADVRVRGEWFDLPAADVERICSISHLHDLDEFPDDLLPHPSQWRMPKSTDDPPPVKIFRAGSDLPRMLWEIMRRSRPRKTVEQTVNDLLREPITLALHGLVKRIRDFPRPAVQPAGDP